MLPRAVQGIAVSKEATGPMLRGSSTPVYSALCGADAGRGDSMKVVIIGANGQLGSDLSKVFGGGGDTVVPVTHAQLDVCSGGQVSELITGVSPDVVVSTAAFHKVEECEEK